MRRRSGRALWSSAISVSAMLGFSTLAHAQFKCFTWSNEILFESVGQDEAVTGKRVVEGCIDYPYTHPEDCKNNLHCFSQQNVIPPLELDEPMNPPPAQKRD